ncbi:hypothetical protein AMAG_08443 [Allomyces macrogynus ATCC 38327]|uniref:Uncharacterized protein n=1 Tax=Allomyces macrogynus (strain ATCC 38327) TaxID=578462 RepID=A0A0L0SLI0_ALLM3|nr:hypothetical protein AMAG_08443 [Allomyces macrogynus ATCC 38327]|eukprot:KNE63303.1 hypothetical protein AMAG_08443 [Allomyces macrogynus ATCC 38327]
MQQQVPIIMKIQDGPAPMHQQLPSDATPTLPVQVFALARSSASALITTPSIAADSEDVVPASATAVQRLLLPLPLSPAARHGPSPGKRSSRLRRSSMFRPTTYRWPFGVTLDPAVHSLVLIVAVAAVWSIPCQLATAHVVANFTNPATFTLANLVLDVFDNTYWLIGMALVHCHFSTNFPAAIHFVQSAMPAPSRVTTTTKPCTDVGKHVEEVALGKRLRESEPPNGRRKLHSASLLRSVGLPRAQWRRRGCKLAPMGWWLVVVQGYTLLKLVFAVIHAGYRSVGFTIFSAANDLLPGADTILAVGRALDIVPFNLICLATPLVYRIYQWRLLPADARVPRTITPAYFFVLGCFSFWNALNAGWAPGTYALLASLFGAIISTVVLVIHINRSQTWDQWRGHFDFNTLYLGGYFVFRALVTTNRNIAQLLEGLNANDLRVAAARLAITTGFRAVMTSAVVVLDSLVDMTFSHEDYWMSFAFRLAEELAVTELALKSRDKWTSIVLYAAANVPILCVQASGILDDLVYSYNRDLSLLDLYRGVAPQSPVTSGALASPVDAPPPSTATTLAALSSAPATVPDSTSSPTPPITPDSPPPLRPWMRAELHARVRGQVHRMEQGQIARLVSLVCFTLQTLIAPPVTSQPTHVALVILAAILASSVISGLVVARFLRAKTRWLGLDVPVIVHEESGRVQTGTAGAAVPSSALGAVDTTLASPNAGTAIGPGLTPPRPESSPAAVVVLPPIVFHQTDVLTCLSPTLVMWVVLFSVMGRFNPW